MKTTTNKIQSTLSNAERITISNEITTLIENMRKGMDYLDIEMSFRDFLSTEDFNYIGIHGEITDYKGLIKEAKAVFDHAQSVQYNFRIANIKVLSHETVLANYISSGTFTFPDTQLYFPECATSLVFIKKLDGWKVIQMQESVQESEFINTTIKN